MVIDNASNNVPVESQSYDVTLIYDNSVTTAQMIALTESSDSCRQELRLDCTNVRIYRADDVALTYWRDRTGTTRGNWGTETNVEGCQCRVDGSK